ncbi:MAG: MlaD family protein [Pseudomonadota bacterium]|nr:MlaD family protein [Pseudomonadota bacterium]
MPGKKEELVVGVFVGVGLLFLSAMAIMLGGDKILFHQYYRIKANFENVDGLVQGSVVSVAGVNVGKIEKIVFSKEGQKLEVILLIDQEYQKRIARNSTAKILTQGALGDKFVFISPGLIGEPTLKNGDTISTHEQGDFLGVLSENSGGIKDIFAIIKEIHTLLQNVNGEGRSLSVMKNLNTSTENLNELIGALKKILIDIEKEVGEDKKLKRSLTHITNILEKIDRGSGTLGSLINDPTLYQRLQEIVGSPSRKGYLKGVIRKSIETKDVSQESL